MYQKLILILNGMIESCNLHQGTCYWSSPHVSIHGFTKNKSFQSDLVLPDFHHLQSVLDPEQEGGNLHEETSIEANQRLAANHKRICNRRALPHVQEDLGHQETRYYLYERSESKILYFENWLHMTGTSRNCHFIAHVDCCATSSGEEIAIT